MMFWTIIAFVACAAVTGTVQAFLPQTTFGQVLTGIVFLYTFEPVARRTFMKGEAGEAYLRFASVTGTVAIVLAYIPPPPFAAAITAAILVTAWTMIVVNWLRRRGKTSSPKPL
jgi:hypothetical protein